MADLRAGAQSGDVVLVKGMCNREQWATTDPAREVRGGYPGGTSYRDVFSGLLDLAEKKDLRVALSLSETPPEGGSAMNVHVYTDPATWTGI